MNQQLSPNGLFLLYCVSKSENICQSILEDFEDVFYGFSHEEHEKLIEQIGNIIKENNSENVGFERFIIDYFNLLDKTDSYNLTTNLYCKISENYFLLKKLLPKVRVGVVRALRTYDEQQKQVKS